MNVKSKFDVEEDYFERRPQTIRGGCGTTLSMISEASQLDVSQVRAPKFLQKIFRALGWKTETKNV